MATKPETDLIKKVKGKWRAANIAPLWEHPTAHKPSAGSVPPRIWHWKTLRPLIGEALGITGPEIVERRVLSLLNPLVKSPDDDSTTTNIKAAIQILAPGETARLHRHSMQALRYVLEGNGASTVVDGKDCPMSEGDLILTPGWSWHGHIHRGDSPIIWLDVLDVPLHQYLGTVRFEPGPPDSIPAQIDDAAFSTPNVVPELPVTKSGSSPVFRYDRASTFAALRSAPVLADRSRRVRFVNPLTGGAALPFLDSYAIGLDEAVDTVPFRTTSTAVCIVMEGGGHTQIGEFNFTWEKNDIFTMPGGNWIVHRAALGGASLMVVTDRDVLSRLNLVREEWGTPL